MDVKDNHNILVADVILLSESHLAHKITQQNTKSTTTMYISWIKKTQ